MESWSNALGVFGLALAVVDFTGLSGRVENVLDRARKGFERLMQNGTAMFIIMFTGGLVLYLALWLAWLVFWLLDKPAKGTVGSLGLLIAIAGFVIGFIY